MPNAIIRDQLGGSSVNRQELDMGGSFARLVASAPWIAGAIGKIKNCKYTLSPTAGTVTSITLPTGVLGVKLEAVTASAIIAAAFGEVPLIVAQAGVTSVAADFKNGVATYPGKSLDMINGGGGTNLQLVSDTNSAVVLVTLFFG